MGDAEIQIHPFVEAVKMNLSDIPNDTIITTVKLNRKNCSADESFTGFCFGSFLAGPVALLALLAEQASLVMEQVEPSLQLDLT
ncbi:unnamed protein product, partial [Musa hybrid cultivar]